MSLTLNESLPVVNYAHVGEIRLLPFRHDELPSGWYFCNGERFLLTSPQGEVLSALSENFRADWGLEEDLCSISLPNLFHEDGRGCFLRAVDGTKRQVGAWEEDAIRNITGRMSGINTNLDNPVNGAFQHEATNWTHAAHNPSGGVGLRMATFDASRVVPTAEENRPLNLGMTPAIYLGV